MVTTKKTTKRATRPNKKSGTTTKSGATTKSGTTAKTAGTKKAANKKKAATAAKAKSPKATAAKRATAKKRGSSSTKPASTKSTEAKKTTRSEETTAAASISNRRASSDRRKPSDRRKKDVPVAAERRGTPRRKVQRRRQIDPTTCERDYTSDEIEFMSALDEYKRTSGRMFPTCSEVLEVLRKLGYERRPAIEESAAMASIDSQQAQPMAASTESAPEAAEQIAT